MNQSISQEPVKQTEVVVPGINTSHENSQANTCIPVQPKSLKEAALDENDVFRLIIKYLYVRGTHTGRKVSEQVKLPFSIVDDLLFSLRNQQLIAYRGSSLGGDYEYELTPKGVEQARQYMGQCTFCGSAPVSLEEYKRSVSRQTLKNLSPKYNDVKNSLSDLVIEPNVISQIGQALNGSSCAFIYGAPGNGKSSIASRVISAVDPYLWIPRNLVVGGEIIRFFDPTVHKEAPMPANTGLLSEDDYDQRWVRIKRPTITVGGELNLNHLEASLNKTTGIIEAPIHLKSNCGCLVVDDFGRQRISPAELLNRWIVPLEAKHDYICLPSGRQIQVPFDQLLIFATNLTPKKIVDEAFLRRIPYKIQVFDPTDEQFRLLFQRRCQTHSIPYEDRGVDYLLEKYYRPTNRPLRFSHVEDIIRQMVDFCDFHDQPKVMNKQTIDMAANNFFSNI